MFGLCPFYPPSLGVAPLFSMAKDVVEEMFDRDIDLVCGAPPSRGSLKREDGEKVEVGIRMVQRCGSYM